MFKRFWKNRKILLLCFICTSVVADLVDPTAPSNFVSESTTPQKSVEVTHYNLQAILVSDVNRVAVINDNVVKVGDTIGNDAVKSIDFHSVTLVGTNGELELKLFENSVKEPVK